MNNCTKKKLEKNGKKPILHSYSPEGEKNIDMQR